MGERANYVLVEDGHFRLFFRHHFMPRSKWYPKKWELYSSTWRARILDSDLAPGPEAAIRCILDQKRRERQEWYDDIECEGAALIDRSRQVLLFFMYVQDFAHRAALLAVLARTWRAWHVQWAFDGTSDLAAYVGLDRAVVRSGGVMLGGPLRQALADLMIVADDDEIDQLVTVRHASGQVDGYGFRGDIFGVLRYGPEMVELLPADARVTACQFPRSGIHIDLVARELGLWAIDPLTGIDEWLPDEWPGWRIELWGDQYQEHIARCAVQVKDWDFGAGLETLAKRLEVAQPYANTHAKPEELERAREVIASLRGNRRNH